MAEFNHHGSRIPLEYEIVIAEPNGDAGQVFLLIPTRQYGSLE